MARIVERKLDPVQKIEVIILEDCFGAKMILQHPLLKDGYDAHAEEEESRERSAKKTIDRPDFPSPSEHLPQNRLSEQETDCSQCETKCDKTCVEG